MVLTDKQRSDLHAGIYEYLLSRPGDDFALAASALLEADPKLNILSSPSNTTPLLEKKWTAVSRLQKKVLELERNAAQTGKIYAHRGEGKLSGGKRKMLPRPPAAQCLRGHSGNVTCVEVHPVYTVVCSGSEDATIKVWDHESAEYIKTLKGHTSTVHSLSFNLSGTYLSSSSSDLSIKIWDFKTYACVRTLRGHEHTISALLFVPSQEDTNHLVSCSRDTTVKFWDLETGFCTNTTSHHNDWVRCISCKYDGSMIATSGNDSVIILHKGFKKYGELRGCEQVVESLAFLTTTRDASLSNPSAHDYLVSGGRDRCVRLWNSQSMECLSSFSFHENWVRSVVLHPSGNYIISAGDDRSIRVFDIKTNRCIRTIEVAHEHFVTSLSIHHTLPIIVSGSVDNTVKCWLLD